MEKLLDDTDPELCHLRGYKPVSINVSPSLHFVEQKINLMISTQVRNINKSGVKEVLDQ